MREWKEKQKVKGKSAFGESKMCTYLEHIQNKTDIYSHESKSVNGLLCAIRFQSQKENVSNPFDY